MSPPLPSEPWVQGDANTREVGLKSSTFFAKDERERGGTRKDERICINEEQPKKAMSAADIAPREYLTYHASIRRPCLWGIVNSIMETLGHGFLEYRHR